jgi:hypothetical protein
VPAEEARSIYVRFILQVVTSRNAWTLRCHGDLILLTGEESGFLPLWPDLDSASFFRAKHWPSLEPAAIPLKALLRIHLRSLARAGVLVGIGIAPHPEALILRANRLRRDLLAAKRDARHLLD